MSKDINEYMTNKQTVEKNSQMNEREQECSFALIADTHIDTHIPKRSEDLASIYQYLQKDSKQPLDFVMHLGDLTECGFLHDYQVFNDLIPTCFRERYYAVPGNHEVRWDEWAGETYRKWFGKTQYSFDKGGIHFIAFNPTDYLLEPGYFTQEDLQWLRQDLSQMRSDTPIILFLHYPMGDNNYFICNQEMLFYLLEEYNVRAVFTGHVHQEDKWEQNGMTMFSLPAVKNGPFFFWVEKRQDDHGKAILSVYSGDALQDTCKQIAEIPLTGERPAEREKPISIEYTPPTGDHSIAGLLVELDHANEANRVQCQFWPEYTWAGKGPGTWKELTKQESNQWSTEWDVSEWSAGYYRLQIRVSNSLDQKWDACQRVQITTTNTLERWKWSIDLQEPIQADLLLAENIGEDSSLIIAATNKGKVSAVTPDGQEVWSYPAGGGIIGTPQYDASHQLIIFGSIDHKVYALNATNGQLIWAYAFQQPVLATPIIDHTQVIVPAGRYMASIDLASGYLHWGTNISGFVAGKPAVDDAFVYFCAGDGYAYALDKSNGAIRWQQVLELKNSPFRTLIYSGWGTKAMIVPKEKTKPLMVVVSTVERTYGMKRNTGEILWESEAASPFAKPLVYRDKEQTKFIFVDDGGTICAVDPYTGNIFWQTEAKQRIINTSPVMYQDCAYFAGVNGRLMGIKLATGKMVDTYHFSTDYVYSTPIMFQELCVLGGHDGILRGVTMKNAL